MIEREPAVAGIFYPGFPKELELTVKKLLGNVMEEKAFGVISPHAGYIYSGRTAGKVFSRVKVPNFVVLICPNHTGEGEKISVFPPGKWKFPGFSVDVSEEISEVFCSYGGKFDTGAHIREHSAEVIVPFLYFKNPNVKISVVALRTLDRDKLKVIGDALRKIKENFKDDVLFVASSDMNHYEPADISKRKDEIAIQFIKSIDPDGLINSVLKNYISMCGVGPVFSLLCAAKYFGIKSAELIDYSNSGEKTGDFSSVVGYAGIIIQ